ncbi:DUF3027 domain-containing protein [Arthrobacter glacialis]|uniref:DUF3027 domain-containing protein n=1 Tax=Arthrobacter glacialis TaxID=1664 RepID=A0A2S3ZV17_ARTGL|nr:DUF3027 domain-containing protein [Arthrobacter glacialis]POH60371.1 DUF3027 domain-containing protein [Arthrobacter glacialis]POH73101.1 DUF3027 domain-containing protein [Arthrobacter glacialis]
MTEFSGESDASAVPEATQRPGVPLWRVGKPDAFLAADVATAREAVRSIANDTDIGRHLGARSEGVRCVTHLFESLLPGYGGWVWFATLARVSRGKASTVNEVGMLPTNDSVLAPPWVPWSERVRPEDQPAPEEEHGLVEPADAEADADSEADADDDGDESPADDGAPGETDADEQN